MTDGEADHDAEAGRDDRGDRDDHDEGVTTLAKQGSITFEIGRAHV